MSGNRQTVCIIVPAHWEAIMGGSQYQAKILTDSLIAEDDCDVHYLTRRVSPSFVPQGYTVHQIASPTGFRRFGEFLDTFDLLKLLRRIRPDAIYQRVGCGYTGIAAYYSKRYKTRCVWHVASDIDVEPFDRKLTKNMGFRYVDKRFLEYGLKNVSAIVTQTEHQARLLWNNYRRRADAVIPNIHPWPAETIQKSERPITVAWVANIKPLKRPELFLRLAEDLVHMDGVEFVMAGRPVGDSGWCREIEAHASRVPNLRFLGAQSQEKVNQLLSGAHIFVNTSDYEGFPNTFIQSWLRRVPVVSLAVNPDDVLNRHNAGIFARTYENLMKSVMLLIGNPDLRMEMGRAAQAFAGKTYSEGNLQALKTLIKGGDGSLLKPNVREAACHETT